MLLNAIAIERFLLSKARTVQMLSIAFAGLFIPQYLSGQVAGNIDKTEVTFVITSCWGDPVDHPTIEVEKSRTGGEIDYPSRSVIRLPRGRYRVRADARGYISEMKEIDVDDRPALVTMCLSVAPISTTSRPYGSIVGKVQSRALKDGRRWVRLYGYYNDFREDALVGEAGDFSITHVQPGLYSIVLFSDGNILSRTDVNVRAMENAIEVITDR